MLQDRDAEHAEHVIQRVKEHKIFSIVILLSIKGSIN